MPTRRLLLLSVLIGLVAFAGRPEAQGPQAVFHGGMSGGLVRDATKVGSTIYAVGSWNNGGRIDGALWTLDGEDPPVFAALPDFCTPGIAGCPTAAVAGGEAITPNADRIVGQARSLNGLTGVRVQRSSLINFNLTPTPPFTNANNKFARAISDDGAILYVQAPIDVGGGAIRNRALRFENGAVTTFYLQPANDGSNFVIQQNMVPRGSSSDGSVAVGSYFTGGPNVDNRAFRYVHGTGTALIPLLDAGTWNNPFAITGNGDIVALVSGISAPPPSPAVEVYTYTPSAATPVTRLGTPNVQMNPAGVGGITDDGSVVANSFSATCVAPCTADRYVYFHNSHGWFHLTSALGAAGVDVSDWRNFQVQGLNGDGTLLWGSGLHNNVSEGFVAEFAPGYLKDFNPQATPPSNTSLVGVWSEDPVGDENHFIVFMADGSYYQIEDGNGGFERGLYTYDGSALTITTLVDTNGSSGLSDMNGTSTPITVNGDTAGDGALHRITGAAGSIVGAWVGGNPAERNSSNVVVFSASTYGTAQDFADDDDGSETGTYTWNSVSHQLDVFPTVGSPDFGNFVTPTPDGRGLHVVDDEGEEFDLARVIDPATLPAITGALSAVGTSGHPFAFNVSASNAVAYSAAGLPGGLAIDAATGEIRGTPEVEGPFTVTLSVANAIGITDTATLALTIEPPILTQVGQNVVVEAEVPEGQGPVTLTFSDVTGGGTTAVNVITLEEGGIPPPGNVTIGSVIYEVTTTATFEGLVTLCFSYEGIDFGQATPRLFHFEDNVWVDITTSVDPATKIICGATTTLSPFAVLASNVVRTGFHAPLNPIAGFLNIAKGGSTVPLKFNVSVNGVNQTTTDGLALTLQMVNCDSNAPEDPVELAAVTGGTTLRYEGGRFIYNWKVPTVAGCYMIRMTTAQDGLALTARFKVK